MSEVIAKRWAKALIDLAMEDSSLSKEQILTDLREVSSVISSSEELNNVINNPAVSVEEKQIVICKLFQGKILSIVYNFLFVLNLKKRLSILDEMIDEYEKELENLNNIVRVKITSAIELNDEKKENIKTRIAEKIHRNINVDWNIDEDIIAGLIMNINDTVIDNSIKNKLENLSKTLIRG